MTGYQTISELDVYSIMRRIELDPMSCGYGVSVPQLAGLLKTSKYQVRKHIHSLREQGAVELNIFKDICNCYEFCECDATGLTWKNWIFKHDLEKYREHDEKQSKDWEEKWNNFIEEVMKGIDDVEEIIEYLRTHDFVRSDEE